MKTLYWFNHDLRLHDNLALSECAKWSDNCLLVYFLMDFAQNNGEMGLYRKQFLLESVSDLNEHLLALGQRLHVFYHSPLETLSQLVQRNGIERIYRSEHIGYYENQIWQQLQVRFPSIQFVSIGTQTLFAQNQIDFEKCNGSFSRFRKKHEKQPVGGTLACVKELPNQPKGYEVPSSSFQPRAKNKVKDSTSFIGGESHALRHLKHYLASGHLSTYKLTRNALDGWSNSSKFSAWLANGNLSAKTLYHEIERYEREVETNESTYWLKFELLWREFFQWHAQLIGTQLYQFQGITNRKPLTSFYPERLKRWQNGDTPYPLVNAIMHQLVETGYISNRARQIAASALVNELQVDWRYGARFFQQHLVDFDIAANWGNWQYIAGVGCDPRGGRHFNIDKQTQMYDPNGEYTFTWRGGVGALDSVDMVDWPITTNADKGKSIV